MIFENYYGNIGKLTGFFQVILSAYGMHGEVHGYQMDLKDSGKFPFRIYFGAFG